MRTCSFSNCTFWKFSPVGTSSRKNFAAQRVGVFGRFGLEFDAKKIGRRVVWIFNLVSLLDRFVEAEASALTAGRVTAP